MQLFGMNKKDKLKLRGFEIRPIEEEIKISMNK
jgi:hypothetical protein